MTTFLKDAPLFRDKVPFRVVRAVGQQVQLENTLTGELSLHDPHALLKEYVDGRLYTSPLKKHVPPTSKGGKKGNFDTLSDVARAETRRRIDYIVKLNAQDAFGKSNKELRAAIVEISKQINDPRPPHHTTVYRWHKQYKKARDDVRALFSRLNHRGGRNKTRLDPTVESLIDDNIENVYLSNKCGTAEDVHDAVCRAIDIANAGNADGEPLKKPGFRTIQRRIALIGAFEICVAKYGIKEATRRFQARLNSRTVSRILELVEIDHTDVDLLVVNEDRVVIGRPVLTAVIDRYSRCVLGFHLTLGDRGTAAAFEALRHALLPKTYIVHRYPDLKLDWPCYGWFELVLMDNGREFHADAIADGLRNLGIPTEYAESREPNDKPFVERFFRTFNYSFIHKLPGTTLAKAHKRIGYKAEDEACITLEELDKLVHAWLIVYHNRPHRSLGRRTPLEVWKESAQAHSPCLKESAEYVEVEFSEITDSALQHYGIDLNTYRYASERLAILRGLLPPRSKVNVKWPRHNVGHIWVWDPFQCEYFKVENTDSSYDGLTLLQARAADKEIKNNPDLQRYRADAKEVCRALVKEAENDKKLKNRRKGARFADRTSRDLHREPNATQVPPLPTTSDGRSNADWDDVGFDEVEMDLPEIVKEV